ncbi:MAG: ester cyclase [Chloroflexi bacterium]|nr:ester cyclase [Chloroflexota bacterium]
MMLFEATRYGAMTAPTNKEVTKSTPAHMEMLADRMWHELWNAGNLEVAYEIIGEDYIGHVPGPLGEIKGPDGFAQLVATCRSAFPNLHVTVEDVMIANDKLVIRWTSRGTNTQDFMGIPATHKSIEVPGITILRVANGLIVEEWEGFDTMSMMRQLGLA